LVYHKLAAAAVVVAVVNSAAAAAAGVACTLDIMIIPCCKQLLFLFIYLTLQFIFVDLPTAQFVIIMIFALVEFLCQFVDFSTLRFALALPLIELASPINELYIILMQLGLVFFVQ